MSQTPMLQLVQVAPGQVLATSVATALPAHHQQQQQQQLISAAAQPLNLIHAPFILNQHTGQPQLYGYNPLTGPVNATQHIQVIPTSTHEQALLHQQQQHQQLQVLQLASTANSAGKLTAPQLVQINPVANVPTQVLFNPATGQIIGQVTPQVTNLAPFQVINTLAHGQASAAIALQPQAGIVPGQTPTTILQQPQPQQLPSLPQTLITSRVPATVVVSSALTTNASNHNLTSHATKVTCNTYSNASKTSSEATTNHTQYVQKIIQKQQEEISQEKVLSTSSSSSQQQLSPASSRQMLTTTTTTTTVGGYGRMKHPLTSVPEEVRPQFAPSQPKIGSPGARCSPESPMKVEALASEEWDEGSNLGEDCGDHENSCSCESRTSSLMEPESTMGGDASSHSTIRQIQSNCTAGETPQIVDGVNLQEVREFANAFKTKRLSFGLTQTQVGLALAQSQGPTYSQSAICRFEKLEITPKSALKIMPVLKEWMVEAEKKYNSGDLCPAEVPGPDSSKRRKRRTSFSPAAIEELNNFFSTKSTHPDSTQMTELADKLNYDREVIRVWFCNKRQALKNTVRRIENDTNNNHNIKTNLTNSL